ncbi:hypothetical protein [Merismopedia glauca]|uniref:Uncharacterized protein n=1 Tax=Merismopedia glauca CCAP 1448/3 TaxID=1296344 RepID=A0A2T1C2I5_9CYAN|nr:hypothetical protein [Merismopedia glauca]PSB02388.1 hypothetical protein C7B64_13460 [Merismopedia glauca CCAP 1448/3]
MEILKCLAKPSGANRSQEERGKKAVRLRQKGLSKAVLIAAITGALLVPLPARAAIFGGGLDRDVLEELSKVLGIDSYNLGSLDEILNGTQAPENAGVSDPDNSILVQPISIIGKDGVNWDEILGNSTFEENALKIANGSIKLGAKNGGVPIAIDYVKLSQILQVSSQAIAANNEKTQANNQVTESVFQDAADTYDRVYSTPANSTLEAIEQSNQIAIANGLVGMAQTKHIQSLVRSLEVSNALSLAEKNQERGQRLKNEIQVGVLERDVGLSRAFLHR